MSNIILPPAFPNKDTRVLSGTRRVSLIGGNGAGKSRFMQEMIRPRRKPRILSVGTVGIVPRTGRIAQGGIGRQPVPQGGFAPHLHAHRCRKRT